MLEIFNVRVWLHMTCLLGGGGGGGAVFKELKENQENVILQLILNQSGPNITGH